jgi:hypothetical protein
VQLVIDADHRDQRERLDLAVELLLTDRKPGRDEKLAQFVQLRRL